MRKKGVFLLFSFLLIFISISFKVEANNQGQLIIINKSTNQLAFFDDGQLVKTYPVATGKTDKLTPEGTFKIVNKIKNRPYYTDNIPGGSPNNPLGDRWLGIDARGTNGTVYAIHGNNNPNSIGKYISAGCVRMYNDDIRSLYDKVKLNTKVIITKSDQSFETIARQHGYSVGPPIEVIMNGKVIQVPQTPYLENGSLFIPLRSISEALGATVQFNKGQIVVTKENKKVSLQVHSKKATINGKTTTLSSAPRIINGSTMVPARVVSEGLGAQVHWNGQKRQVEITYQGGTSQSAVQTVKVNVNDVPLEVGAYAFIENNRVQVPLRDIFEALGAEISWDEKSNTMVATKDHVTVELKLNATVAIVNGSQVALETPAKLYKEKMVVPIRFVSESLGARVEWVQKEMRVDIYSE
ncbi:MAG TPA: L,D-transpeptidase family protein [Bacilli bacterium]|nr:L,D-transpeptidase family protein [Bacilli bacterium]